MRKLIPVLCCSLLFSGCLYTNIHSPYSYRSATPQEAKAAAGDETVTGKTCYHSILWLVAWGDAGSAAAAKEGGITTLRHMDVETTFILFGVYASMTTIVYGD